MIEEAEYNVRITLTLVVGFAPIERKTRITKDDAIGNAFGSAPDEVWEMLEAEGFNIEAEAERL